MATTKTSGKQNHDESINRQINGGKTFDRYTIYFKTPAGVARDYYPWIPGKRGCVISFEDLPPDVQKVVRSDLKDLVGPDSKVSKITKPSLTELAAGLTGAKGQAKSKHVATSK